MPQEPPGFDDFYDDDFDPTRKVWFVPTIAQGDSEFAKRLRWDLFLGGTVLGLLIVLTVGWFLWRQTGEDTPSASAEGPGPQSISSPANGGSPASGQAQPGPSTSPLAAGSPAGSAPVTTTVIAETSPANAGSNPVAVATSPIPQTSPVGQSSPVTTVTEVPPAIATTVTSAPTTVVPAETTVPPVVLSGNRSVHTQVQKNDGDHPNDIPADITLNFFITRDRSVMPNAVHITVSGGGLPTMTGNTVIGPTFDSPGGTASASGGGMYRGFSTSYAIGFTIGASAVSGTITIGGDGGLPGGQPLILSFAGGPPF